MVDWEAHLATILHHTNLNLEREFSKEDAELHNTADEIKVFQTYRPSAMNEDPGPGPFYPPKYNSSTGNQHQGLPPHYTAKKNPGPNQSSHIFDINEMIEQLRISIKMEVDARASTAERQLNTILHHCQNNTEDIDRLRGELTGTSRHLRIVEQYQSKFQTDLSTQQELSTEFQALYGKEETWRFQNENQLLELRQLVASLREQCQCLMVSFCR